MLRTHTCGELTIADLNKEVTLTGWVQKSRDLGGMTFIDMRDRYGITQLTFNSDDNAEMRAQARELGREYVIKVSGKVIERSNKNLKMATGEVEIKVSKLELLNAAKLPPFLIEDETDGGDDLRLKYRYLDLRRNPVRNNLILRHKMAQEVRKYLDGMDFIEVETPVLIKSTPEGARDFVVPSRMNPGEFYALPQSPQTFKQLLMVSGFDRYFQIVKCFRDEDLRADRQPEFTQIDCEMAFIEQEDILNVFEGLIRTLFKNVKGIDLAEVPRMQYADAMRLYGSDKPDTRFDMKFVELKNINLPPSEAPLLWRGGGEATFPVFDNAELVIGINAKACAEYTRKQLDELTDFIKRPQIGGTGLIYMRHGADGSLKSSVDKFYNEDDLKKWSEAFNSEPGDLILIMAGQTDKVRKQLNELRLEMGNRLGLRDKDKFAPLWVLDFPLLEWDEESGRYHAMHHPFTSPKPEDIAMLDTNPGQVRANAYDMVVNGTEIGGGSIRIHDRELQSLMFKHLGFSIEEAQKQFGFLLDAFEYGAPPHGGIAFGFDRLVSIFAGLDSIRDVIAFPKNNSGRDVMIDSPSTIADEQLKELKISTTV
ncbi:MAG: aspartate--tRNA ligase [Sphingobacteriales bacterium 17-39-43]|uniref:aspartate--tRNA ligase n=1 Tax=Daejeonella sp. TaxID=2805397 RepID=UPI000BC9CF41|nr:aspartate--tRNA ligase [Daejeonella sp.]OYY05852.1 MAG: aspartate--tRNA ligase [Sphingobacteriia bacterium 35-40-5]OYZ32124.1 MAG: aspartate--tRNA ligase [Sphingobacteriales bacterium 16-39-50]OZA25468.1 MAG: aspartate--tRNA ligase [Sphingobacteriales bacterium 17-39-43]OZA57749.1 MAG: aspartate--tRNA ligase [Sphingobacteriales bacterium 39-40-5]HQS52045.1 aspartate--tRNA ligase [Daejeonella sp.]